MGCLVTLSFLQNQPQQWKDKYIASFVSVNGPYGGAMKALLALIHGYNLDIKFISPHILRDMQRTFLSTYLMLPNRKAFHPDFLIFFGPSERQFSIKDLENGNLLKAIGHPQGHDLNKLVANAIDLIKPVGVKVHCVNGDGIPTVNALKTNKYNWPEKVTEMFFGGGDGTVNQESLKLCEQLNTSGKGLQYHHFAGGKHVEMLKSDKLAQLLVDIVKNDIPSASNLFYNDHHEEEDDDSNMLLDENFKDILGFS